MIALRACMPALNRAAGLTLATLLLASCAGQASKPASTSSASPPSRAAHKPWKPLGPYTPGGLYAPGVSDGAPDVPPDVANLPEPVPHSEPPSRYGNRSPYVVLGKTYSVLPSAAGYVERGMASWYGTKFDGRVTSSFEPYDLSQFSAAHKTLPLPSYARVTNLENGRSVIVRINDRGPFHEGRLIDLSYAAAIKLGVNVHGTAMVEVRGIDTSQMPPALAPDIGASKPAATHAVNAAPKPVAARSAANKPDVPMPELAAVAPPLPAAEEDDDTPSPLVAAASDAGNRPVAVASAKDDEATNADVAAVPEAANPLIRPAVTRAATDATAPAPVTPLPESTPAAAPATVPAAAPASAQAVAQTPGFNPQTAASVASFAAAVAVPTGIPTVPTATPSFAPLSNLIPNSVAPPGSSAIPAPPPAPPAIGHPAIDPSTRGFLQIASYGDRSNAEHMMQRLQQAGVDHVELVSVQVADQTLWRVHIGPMRADEAERVAAHLDTMGFGTPPFFKE